MENILYRENIRNKRRKWYYFFMFFSTYYQRENIPLKEKLYTYWYNCNRTGFETQGEGNYFLEIYRADKSYYDNLKSKFDKDYVEFLKSPKIQILT